MSRATVALDEASALKERGQNLWHLAEREMHDRPWRTSALALGAGYLLGGGLFSSLTARLLALGVRVGLRVGVAPLVAAGVSEWVGQSFEKTEDEDRHSSEPTPSRRRRSS